MNKKTVVSIVFIITLILIRFVIKDNIFENIIVAWINFFGIMYVLVGIFIELNTYFEKHDIKSSIFKSQHTIFKIHFSRIVCILFIVVIIYSILLRYNQFIIDYGGCINDSIALISLGFSLEDEYIISKLKNYYHYL